MQSWNSPFLITDGEHGKFASTLPAHHLSALLAITITLIFFRKVSQDYSEKTNLPGAGGKNEETENRLSAIEKVTAQISNGDYDILSDRNPRKIWVMFAHPLNRMALPCRIPLTPGGRKEGEQRRCETQRRMMGEKTMEHLAADILESLTEHTESSVAALICTKITTCFGGKLRTGPAQPEEIP